MNSDQEKQRAAADEALEREFRLGRKFTPEEAMARMAGPGAMKGASPISEVQQAEIEIGTWLRDNIADAGGALKVVLHRQIKGNQLLLDNLGQPLRALAEYLHAVLASEERLKELVRQTDVEWGRSMGERPYFERDGSSPDPDDPYTAESVQTALHAALKLLPPESA